MVRRRPRVKVSTGGGAPGALGGASVPFSHASHSGLWISPVKGLGALERWGRSLSSLRDILVVALGWSDHPTWMRRQIKTRATRRSWYNNRFGVMMTSPLT